MSKISFILSKEAFLVGSRAWGGHSKDSDFDYVIPEKHREEITKYLEDNRIKVNEPPYLSKASIYANIDNLQINLIFLPPRELKAWQYASSMMEKFPKEQVGIRTLRRFSFILLVNAFLQLGDLDIVDGRF